MKSYPCYKSHKTFTYSKIPYFVQLFDNDTLEKASELLTLHRIYEKFRTWSSSKTVVIPLTGFTTPFRVYYFFLAGGFFLVRWGGRNLVPATATTPYFIENFLLIIILRFYLPGVFQLSMSCRILNVFRPLNIHRILTNKIDDGTRTKWAHKGLKNTYFIFLGWGEIRNR